MSATSSITIEAAVLAKAMKAAASVTERRNTIPILANALLFTEGGALQLVTTDLDVEYRQNLPLADQAGEMATTVDAHRLSALANAAPKGGQIKLSLDDGRLTVKAGRSRWVLPVLPRDDFPQIVAPDAWPATIEMVGKELAAALARVSSSISTEETRYYLNGVFLHGEDGNTAFAATNGHTLLRQVSQLSYPDDAPEVIVPRKTVQLMQSLCGDADGEVSLRWDASKMQARFGDGVLTSKLVDGTFPEYRRVIPGDCAEVVRVAPEGLRLAARRTALISDGKTRAVKLAYQADKLMLTATSAEYGSGAEEVPAECADRFEAGFNAQYLEQIMDAVGGDTVEIHQDDAGAPARITRVPADGCTAVIMPMRV